MEDTTTHPQPHPETDKPTHPQDSHPTPTQHTEPTHPVTHPDTKSEKPVEHEKTKVAAPAATVEHKDEPKDKPKDTAASPVKADNKEKHEKAEEHAKAVPHDAKTDNHAQPKPEHKEAEKKEASPTKPQEPHADANKAEHKETEKKDASPIKQKEEHHTDSAKVEHKEPEKKEASPQKPQEPHADAKKAEHKEPEKKEASPQKSQEPHADAQKVEHKEPEKKEASPQKPQEPHADASKTEHKKDDKIEASPQKPKQEVHSEVKTDEHKEPAKPDASPQKPKEAVHVEAKVEVKAHEPEHKTNEAHKVEEKTVASHELDQGSSQPNQAVAEKSPEKTEAAVPEKKSPKVGRSSTTAKKSPDARASDGAIPTKDKILEVKKMKQAYEDQLKVLNQELNILSKQERFEKQVLSADISKKSLTRDPLSIQKNSAKLLRPIDRSAFDYKNKPSTVRASENGESAERVTEEDEAPRRRLPEVKRVNRLKDEPLYLKMEKQFVEKIVCPELEKRKEALKQKREFAKPIELKELKEHAVKYNQVSKKEILNKQMARMERDAIEHEKAEKVINVYKSSMLKHVLEKDEEHKIRDDKKAQEKKQLKERQLQYGKLVKEMYQPKIDEKLRQGLNEKIQAAKTEEAMRKARQAKEPKTDYSGKTWKSRITHGNEVHSTDDIKGEYSSEGKSRVEKFLTKPKVKKDLGLPETLPESELPDAVKKINESLKEKIEKTGSREGQPRGNAHRDSESNEAKVKVHKVQSSPKKKDKSVEGEAENNKEGEKPKKAYNNYLDEVRKKRMEQEKNGAKVKYGQWEKVLKNKDMSYQDKVLNILDDVNRIEHQAKMKEEKLKQQDHGAEPVDLEGQVTDMYLESIKAKLALIQGLS